MATRRHWQQGQYQMRTTDDPSVGLIAEANQIDPSLATLFIESKNLFLRKLGNAMVALQDSKLSPELLAERDDWDKAIAEALAELARKRQKADKQQAEKRAILVKAKFSQGDIDNMLNGLANAQESEWAEVRERVSQGKERILEIDLSPIRTVNSDFLDLFATKTKIDTGNGTRNVNGTIHVVHFQEGDFYVAVETPDVWRLYNSDKSPAMDNGVAVDNFSCKGITVGSKTMARKLAYVWQYKTAYGKAKSIATLNKVYFPAINAGGVGADGELIEFYSEVENFK